MKPTIVRPATPADAAGIARVHVDTWRTTYRGVVPDDFLARLAYDKSEARWTQTLGNPSGGQFAFVGVEERSGEVVGFAVAGPERDGDPTYTGEVYALYILQAYQRQGLGRRLMAACARELSRRGFGSVLVWVLADNPCRLFYETLGGRRLRAKPLTIGGTTLQEIAYGWPEAGLLDASPSQREDG